MLRYVDSIWIHKGNDAFGGGNYNLQIHTGTGEEYIKYDILEEVFIHEATHTSLDSEFLKSEGWFKAMIDDNGAISNYARDYPGREDLAETMGPYFAVSTLHNKSDKLDQTLVNNIRKCIPNRIAFLDKLCKERNWTMDILT
jgi:hypothetical protein